jgi:hypothetical protein
LAVLVKKAKAAAIDTGQIEQGIQKKEYIPATADNRVLEVDTQRLCSFPFFCIP